MCVLCVCVCVCVLCVYSKFTPTSNSTLSRIQMSFNSIPWVDTYAFVLFSFFFIYFTWNNSLEMNFKSRKRKIFHGEYFPCTIS